MSKRWLKKIISFAIAALVFPNLVISPAATGRENELVQDKPLTQSAGFVSSGPGAELLGPQPVLLPKPVPKGQSNPAPGTKTAADEILVRFKDGNNGDRVIARHAGKIQSVQARQGFSLIKTTNAQAAERLLAELKSDPSVKQVQPNYRYTLAAVPNDQEFSRQWGLQRINAPQAWDVSPGSPGALIAIVDTGIDVNHPDLRNKIAGQYDAVNRSEGYAQDIVGHGTHVAGIAAATAGNGTGIAGVSPNSQLLAVRAAYLDAAGNPVITTDAITAGIDWAVAKGAKVVNLSLGGADYDPLLAQAVENAVAKGVVVVAAAGNDNGGPVEYPAAFPGVIAVAATNSEDVEAPFSAQGPQVAVSAPGADILSTYYDPSTGASSYASMSGTSMAAPFVTGAAALLLGKEPNLTPAQVADRIEKGAADLGDPGTDPEYGAGRLDVLRTLQNYQAADRFQPNNSAGAAYHVYSGMTWNARVDGPGEVDYFYIQAQSNNLTLDFQAPGDLDADLSVLDSSRKAVYSFHPGKGGQLKTKVSLPGPGGYYLAISGEGGGFSANPYTVSLSDGGDSREVNDTREQAKDITNTAGSATLTPAGDIDWYQVNLKTGGQVYLAMGGPVIDAAFDVFKPNGNLIQHVNAGYAGVTEQTSIWLNPGKYYINMYDYNDTPDVSYNFAAFTAPRVQSLNYPDGSGVNTTEPTVIIKMDQNIDPAGVNSGNVLLKGSDGTAVNSTVSLLDSSTISLKPDTPLTVGNTYQLVVANLKNPVGLAMAGAFTAQFTITNTAATLARLAGSDRDLTAIAVAQRGWPTGADTVVLARDDDFPDALAGTPLAYKYNAPILLTNPSRLTPAVETELDRLRPQKVFILGSAQALSGGIEQSLKAKSYVKDVERLGGADRFDTAAKIAVSLGSRGEAVVAYGFNFPDALAVSPWAAFNGVPILLTAQDSLPAATQNALSDLGVTKTVVVGSAAVVSDSVAAKLPGANRYWGADRYQTAVEINRGLGLNLAAIYVATGENFPDALAGSALAARGGNAIVLVDGAMLEPEVSSFLAGSKGKVDDIVTLGSEAAVPQSVVDTVNGLVN